MLMTQAVVCQGVVITKVPPLIRPLDETQIGTIVANNVNQPMYDATCL